MYVQGENPAMSDPDANHAREALAALDHLVVQDIFLTETAYLADVILPAGAFPEKTRQLHQHRPPGADGPPGHRPAGRCAAGPVDHPADRRSAWACPGTTSHVSEVFDEMRHTMPSIGGITWERLEREHAVTYPCHEEGDPGEPVVFVDSASRARAARRASCRPTSSRPPSAPMPSTRWC